MAIYEYQCKDCGVAFQARRAMKDADAPITCPDCGSFHAKRGLSRFFAAISGGGGGVSSSSGGGCASCSGHSCASCGGH